MITPFGLVCFWGPGCLCASGSHGFLLVLGPACLPRKGKIRCIAASRAATDLILSMGRMRKKGRGTPRRCAAQRRRHKGQTGCPVDVGHVRKGRRVQGAAGFEGAPERSNDATLQERHGGVQHGIRHVREPVHAGQQGAPAVHAVQMWSPGLKNCLGTLKTVHQKLFQNREKTCFRTVAFLFFHWPPKTVLEQLAFLNVSLV